MKPLRLFVSVALGSAALAAIATPAAAQQRLTLAEAFRRADQAAYANRIARGEVQTQSGVATSALAGVLPSVRAEAGYLQTTDPLAAFGFILRQRSVSPAAFDPARLNAPSAISDYGAAFIVEQPLINVDAWLGRAAASAAGQARASASEWTRQGVRADIVRAYFGAILAQDRVATLEAALRAAQEHARQAGLMLRQGLVTRSDTLLAEVRAGEVAAELMGGRNDVHQAHRQLALLMGMPDDSTFTLPATLPGSDRVRALVCDTGLRLETVDRADVQAARLGATAAARAARRSRAGLLPRLNAFGRYDWHDADRWFGGSRSWTVGLMAIWSPFRGGGQLGEMQAAGGRAAVARARADAAAATAAVEAASRRDDLRLALAQWRLAEQAVAQAEEAHRIVTRQYQGGLATIAQVLDAAATETRSRVQLANRRYQVIVAEAARRRATGEALTPLTVLED